MKGTFVSFPSDLDLFDESEQRPIGGPKTGIVMVAVANFVVGILLIVLAGMMIAQVRLPAAMQPVQTIRDLTADMKLEADRTKRMFDVLGMATSAANIIAIVFGTLCLAAGIGVSLRAIWGRALSLLLGMAANVIALIAIVTVDLASIVLYGSYSLLALLILRDKDYERQFR
jgi:hypothetical protein